MGFSTLPRSAGEQAVFVRWITLLFGSATFYSIILLILTETATASIDFIVAFIIITGLVPISMSIGASIYLSNFGENRILHVWDMNLITIPTIVLVQLVVHFQNFGTFFGNSIALSVYAFVFGLMHDAMTRPILGVSGGISKTIREVVVCNADYAVLRQSLNDPEVADQLQMERIENIRTYGLETARGTSVNCLLFALPDPRSVRRSVVLLIGYEQTPFEILPSIHARHFVTDVEADLLWLLGNKIKFNRPRRLEAFIMDVPRFRFLSREAVDYALQPTKIPLTRFRRLSTGAKWFLLAITVPVTAIVILSFAGLLSTENLAVTLAPTIVLIGLELFAVFYNRREL